MSQLATGLPPVRSLPQPSEFAVELYQDLLAFMSENVLPAEAAYARYRTEAGPDDHSAPPVVEVLKAEARRRGLWNLFLPAESGLTQLEYAPMAEVTGWCHDLAPEALNGQAPDSGNMELFHLFGTTEQKKLGLDPLVAGEIRSAFAMTEPDVASSDATNIATQIRRDGDDYVVSGRKWWASGAHDPRCSLLTVMGKTDSAAPPHRQQTMVLVPTTTVGVHVERSTPVFGRQDQGGHSEIVFDDVRVPTAKCPRGGGRWLRRSPGETRPGATPSLHAGNRCRGAMTVKRARSRVAFGGPLADQGSVQHQIAQSRLAIDQARALCHQAAWTIDAYGNREARHLVAMAKVAVPRAALGVIDRAIQIHGGAGVTDDTPLAAMWGWHRAMRIFDGPDEVHLRSLASAELRRAPLFPVG